MTPTRWDDYCRTVANVQIYYRLSNGFEIPMPDCVKRAMLAQAIEECGRGTLPPAVEANNFHMMQYREDIPVSFPIEKYPYVGPDGLRDYCKFRTLREEIIGYLCFILGRAQYTGAIDHMNSERDWIDWIGRTFCSFGYTDEFMGAHGGKNYTDVICGSHLTEAIAELAKYGRSYILPVLSGSDLLNSPLEVVNGMLMGERVHRRFIKGGHYTWKRPRTIGIMIHVTGCHAGTSRIKVDGLSSPGILDAWDDPKAGRGGHILNTRDGNIWQAVDLTLPAWGVAGWNNDVIHIENEAWGHEYPSKEILGSFYKYLNTLWMQRIAKSDMVKVGGLYYENFADVEIINTIREIEAIRAFHAPAKLWVKGHGEMPGTTHSNCPGPLWPWDRIQREG